MAPTKNLPLTTGNQRQPPTRLLDRVCDIPPGSRPGACWAVIILLCCIVLPTWVRASECAGQKVIFILSTDDLALPVVQQWLPKFGQTVKAEVTGKPAARILRGEIASADPAAGRLPSGSTVMDREPSLWGSHRRFVIAALGFILFQSGLIGALLVARSRATKTQHSLWESEARLRAFIDGSDDAICMRDCDRRLVLWNRAFAHAIKTNCGVDVRAGMRAEDYVAEEVLARFGEQREQMHRAYAGQSQRAEFEFPCPDGRLRYFDTSWFPVRAGEEIIAVAEITRDITETKAAELAFRQSNERFNAYMKNSTEAIWCVEFDSPISLDLPEDEQLRRIYEDASIAEANDVYARQVGRTHGEQLRGTRISEILPRSSPESDAALRELIRARYRVADLKTTEHYSGVDGLCVILNNIVGIIEEGHLLKVWGTHRNITEQEAARDELRRAEEKYRTVVENANEAIVVVQDGVPRYANAQALELTGYSAEELRTTPFLDYIHPEDRVKAAEVYQKRLAGPTPPSRYAVRVLTKADETRWVLANSARIQWEGRPASLAMLTDITPRMQAEEELRASQQTLRRAQSLARIGSWHLDIRAGTLAWSDETYRIFGIREGLPPTYERFLEVVHPEDRTRVDKCWNASFQGAPFDIEHRIVVDGDVRWVRAIAEIAFDDEGRAVTGIGTAQEITGRKVLEMESHRLRVELAHMDRVNTTSVLTAAIAHEINQPLAAVLSNAQAALRFLSHERSDLDEVRDALRDIVRDDKRAAEVIRRLRALLKKESPNPELFDVNAVVAEVISLVHSEVVIRNASLTTDLAERPSRVFGDRVQIQQVILNLLMNALDAVKGQSSGERNVVVASHVPGGEAVEISVTDSGGGIGSGEFEKIFDPFYSTKPGGMGMGLAISRSIIGGHGGRLWAERAPGGGARLSFTLPVK